MSEFRISYFTVLCLSFFNGKIFEGFENGLLSGLILFDLQQAFGTINHEVFPDKL